MNSQPWTVELLLQGNPEYAKFTKAKLLAEMAKLLTYIDAQRRDINTKNRRIEMLQAVENINESSGTK